MNGIVSVFSNKKYFFLFLFIFIFLTIGIVLFPNLSLLKDIFNSDVNINEQIKFLFSLIFSNPYYANFWSLIYLLTISLLSSVGITMSVYIFRQKIRQTKGIGLGMVGTLATLIGVGCVSCGSFFVLTILSYFGIASLVTNLPYHGQEIGFLGILLLCISIYYMSKNIDKPLVC